jgi:ATP-dependent DNA ligase
MSKSKQNTDTLIEKYKSIFNTSPKSFNKEDVLSELQLHFLNQDSRKNDFGLQFIMQMKSPALCKQLHDVPEKIRNPIINGTCSLNQYLVEQKYDGVRMLVTFKKDEGLDFYTRNISNINYLPISYKDNLIINDNNIGNTLTDFVLDCEIISNYTIEKESQLQCVTSLLSNLPEEAKQKQIDNPGLLSFMVFDCLQCNGINLINKPLSERRDFIKQVLQHLDSKIFIASKAILNKQPIDAFNELVAKGCEGIVIKDITLPYNTTGSRTKSGWIKWKSFVEPIDCFISGFDVSDADSRKGLIATLHFSVYVENNKQIHIASCSNFNMDLRKQMSEVTETGEVILKSEWYGMVAEITGLEFSTVNKRFVHSIIKQWRPDRSSYTCIINSSIFN